MDNEGASSGRFLDLLEPSALAALQDMAVVRHWRAGSQLAREGARAARVLVVQAGRVKAVVSSLDGTEVVLAVRGPGEIVGEVSAIDDRPHSATAVAMDDVACLAVERSQFWHFLAEHPSGATAIATILAMRLREADSRRAEYGVLDSTARAARRLAELAGEQATPAGDDHDITVRLSQEELAGFTGSSREAVSRALRMLREDGLVTTSRRRVTIHDLEALRRRST